MSQIPVPTLQRRLVFALLRPAARLCRRFGLALGEVEDLVRLAYFEELRQERGASHAEIARAFGRSLRLVGMLERQFRSDFLQPQREIELARAVERALDVEPLRASDLAACFEGVGGEVLDRVLAGLVGAGRVRIDAATGRYVLDHAFVSIVSEDLRARVGALEHQLLVVEGAVVQRFLGVEPRPSAARTWSFVATREEAEAMAQRVPAALRAECVAVENASLGHGAVERYGLTIALAPASPAGSEGGSA